MHQDDADQRTVVAANDRNAPDAVRPHALYRLEDAVVLRPSRVPAHQAPERQIVYLRVFGDHFDYDIAVGHDTGRETPTVAAVHNNDQSPTLYRRMSLAASRTDVFLSANTTLRLHTSPKGIRPPVGLALLCEITNRGRALSLGHRPSQVCDRQCGTRGAVLYVPKIAALA